MARFEQSSEILDAAVAPEWNLEEIDEKEFRDDQLRLIFTCCHPALPPSTRTAMTLREICGLTTEEVASALLSTPPTIAQRIVRGKAKIREERIPYRVPSRRELPERLESVLSVLYLVFNGKGSATGRGQRFSPVRTGSPSVAVAYGYNTTECPDDCARRISADRVPKL